MSSQSQPDYTIIIPVTNVNDYVRETVQHILRLAEEAWELIIVVNDEATSEWDDPRIHLVSSGRVGPAAKRDLVAEAARGRFLVFLDDDSYPSEDLLAVARPYFDDPCVVAVGGPAVTPPEDGFWQRVSGAVFVSRFSGGAPERYVPTGHVREVRDWPSVNFMVRKSSFLDVGGFDTAYWPGEDTKLCLELVRTGKKILYVPNLIVWHHRRSGLFAHIRQVGAYGLHRGFFAKRYPETSLRPSYLAPSALVVFCLLSLVFALGGLPRSFQTVLLLGWGFYGLALIRAFIDFRTHAGFWVACCAVPYSIGTHLVYGLQFIRGFVFKRSLVSQLR